MCTLFWSVLKIFFSCSITGNQNEDFPSQKSKLLSKKNLHSTDKYPLGPRLILYPGLPRLHGITAWYRIVQSQVKVLRAAVFPGGSFLRPRLHLPIKVELHLLRPARRKLVGRPRRRGFGKWSWIVGTARGRSSKRFGCDEGMSLHWMNIRPRSFVGASCEFCVHCSSLDLNVAWLWCVKFFETFQNFEVNTRFISVCTKYTHEYLNRTFQGDFNL